jgi:hypothetical protein
LSPTPGKSSIRLPSKTPAPWARRVRIYAGLRADRMIPVTPNDPWLSALGNASLEPGANARRLIRNPATIDQPARVSVRLVFQIAWAAVISSRRPQSCGLSGRPDETGNYKRLPALRTRQRNLEPGG